MMRCRFAGNMSLRPLLIPLALVLTAGPARADGESARPGELLVEGARVRDGRDRPRVIVPWDEGPGKGSGTDITSILNRNIGS